LDTGEIEIVPLEKDHIEKATFLIAEAFVNEPGTVATIRKSLEKRLPLLRKHFGAQTKFSLPRGVSRGAFLNGELVGVMIISAPGKETITNLEMAKLLLSALFQTNPGILWRGMKSSMEDDAHRPKEPNSRRETIAVDPKRQGRGIGSTMLSYLTDLADREGVLTYLSTTDPKTVPFYKTHGFRIISETNELGIPNYHLVRKLISA